MSDAKRATEHDKSARRDLIERQRKGLESSFRFASQKETRRDRAYDALQTAIDHFDELGVARDVLTPLVEIQDALWEGERGLLHPLFKPDEKSGRPRLPLVRLEQQRVAALAMDALILAGQSRETAAREVAKVLRKIGYPFRRDSTAQWLTVAEIRDDLARNLAKTTLGHGDDIGWSPALYAMRKDSLCRAVNEQGKDPIELAKQLLNELSAIRS
jgi:hypothetical protein